MNFRDVDPIIRTRLLDNIISPSRAKFEMVEGTTVVNFIPLETSRFKVYIRTDNYTLEGTVEYDMLLSALTWILTLDPWKMTYYEARRDMAQEMIEKTRYAK